MKEKEKVIIDVHFDETGVEIYKVETIDGYLPVSCKTSGFFVSEYALEEWIEENRDDLIIHADFRGLV